MRTGVREGFMDYFLLAAILFVFLLIQPIPLILGAIYFIKARRSRVNLHRFILTTVGVLSSLVFISMTVVPYYLEAQERERLPKEYQMWWPFVEDMLKTYKKQNGEYPPVLMPYLKPDIDLENESAFPGDYYSKPQVQRYWYDGIGKQWLDHGKPMKKDPAPNDFDLTGYYRYYTDRKGYILIGNGPDYDADLDAKESFLAARRDDMKKLIQNKYDPTNGTNSGGDYWVLKLK